jgi:hypothetical protein
MGVAAKAFDLEIVLPGVEGVASDEKRAFKRRRVIREFQPRGV